jgi:hypothetical protein
VPRAGGALGVNYFCFCLLSPALSYFLAHIKPLLPILDIFYFTICITSNVPLEDGDKGESGEFQWFEDV